MIAHFRIIQQVFPMSLGKSPQSITKNLALGHIRLLGVPLVHPMLHSMPSLRKSSASLLDTSQLYVSSRNGLQLLGIFLCPHGLICHMQPDLHTFTRKYVNPFTHFEKTKKFLNVDLCMCLYLP